MKSKTKIMLTIMSMCLVLSLAVLGIYAVTTLNMSVGGNISFTADGISVVVSDGVFKTEGNAEYENIMTDEDKLQGFEMNTDTKLSAIKSKLDSWTGLTLTMSELGDAYLHFSITNKMSTTLYVYVSVNMGTSNKNMDITATPLVAELSANETKAYIIKFDIIDTTINAEALGFKVDIDMSKESIMKTQNKIDSATGLEMSEADYFYVEMGSYNGQPIRWRYVANPDGTRYSATTAPTSLSGYYLQQTYIDHVRPFLDSSKYSSSKHIAEGYTSIYASDYALSDLRAFLTGTGEDSIMDVYSISSSDMIYSLIEGRTITDLYVEIGYSNETITSSNTNFALSLTGDKDVSGQVDKFWAPSKAELSTYLPTVEERAWDHNYWLRGYMNGLFNTVLEGRYNGNIEWITVGTSICPRVAFKIA